MCPQLIVRRSLHPLQQKGALASFGQPVPGSKSGQILLHEVDAHSEQRMPTQSILHSSVTLHSFLCTQMFLSSRTL